MVEHDFNALARRHNVRLVDEQNYYLARMSGVCSTNSGLASTARYSCQVTAPVCRKLYISAARGVLAFERSCCRMSVGRRKGKC